MVAVKTDLHHDSVSVKSLQHFDFSESCSFQYHFTKQFPNTHIKNEIHYDWNPLSTPLRKTLDTLIVLDQENNIFSNEFREEYGI